MTSVGILHFTCPPIVGGVELLIALHSRLLLDHGHQVHAIAGRGSRYNRRVPLTLIPALDSKHPRLLAVNDELKVGEVSARFDALADELAEHLRAPFANLDVCIVHNALSLHFNLPLTVALTRLIASRQAPRLIAWCHDLSWTNPLYVPLMREREPWSLLKTRLQSVDYVVVSDDRRQDLLRLWNDTALPPTPNNDSSRAVAPPGVSGRAGAPSPRSALVPRGARVPAVSHQDVAPSQEVPGKAVAVSHQDVALTDVALTPALSQGERGSRPPLPLGEGRGEGSSLLPDHWDEGSTLTGDSGHTGDYSTGDYRGEGFSLTGDSGDQGDYPTESPRDTGDYSTGDCEGEGSSQLGDGGTTGAARNTCPARDEGASPSGEDATHGEESITVIPAGVDPAAKLRFRSATIQLARQLHLDQARPFILLPARITKRKNIEYAIRVTRALRDLGAQPLLLVTGPPGPHNVRSVDYVDELQAERRALDVESEVIFLYEQRRAGGGTWRATDPMMDDLYQMADILLFPSAQEGFGIPLLEAGLVRLPIFCSNIPPFREIAGDAAHVFELSDPPSDVAKRILSLLATDPTSRMRRRVLDAFTWERVFAERIAPLVAGREVGDVPTTAAWPPTSVAPDRVSRIGDLVVEDAQ